MPICKIMARRASWSNCNCTNIIIYLLGNFLTSQCWFTFRFNELNSQNDFGRTMERNCSRNQGSIQTGSTEMASTWTCHWTSAPRWSCGSKLSITPEAYYAMKKKGELMMSKPPHRPISSALYQKTWHRARQCSLWNSSLHVLRHSKHASVREALFYISFITHAIWCLRWCRCCYARVCYLFFLEWWETSCLQSAVPHRCSEMSCLQAAGPPHLPT